MPIVFIFYRESHLFAYLFCRFIEMDYLCNNRRGVTAVTLTRDEDF